MELPVIYVMTHDSIGLGEDGPTHQPIEHLASLRAMPHLCIIRPADANETAQAWRIAIERKNGPTVLVLSRQNLPILDHEKFGKDQGVARGAYILSKEKARLPQVILIASGSEVHLLLEAQQKLWQENIDARVVSMPSWELFREQTRGYCNKILPRRIKVRLAVEAGSAMGWLEWVGPRGEIMGIDKFGASAPYQEIYRQYGLTVDNILEKVKNML
jgi:transketolase